MRKGHVHYDSWFFWVEVAHVACARVGDIPEGDTVILGHEVDVGHGEAGRVGVKGGELKQRRTATDR